MVGSREILFLIGEHRVCVGFRIEMDQLQKDMRVMRAGAPWVQEQEERNT